MPTFVSCPDCGAAAQITERFRLPSTDGPVEHIAVHCGAGHHFRMPADWLLPDRLQTDRLAGRQAQPQARQRPAPAGLPC